MEFTELVNWSHQECNTQKKKTWEYVKAKRRAMKENEKAQHKRKAVPGGERRMEGRPRDGD